MAGLALAECGALVVDEHEVSGRLQILARDRAKRDRRSSPMHGSPWRPRRLPEAGRRVVPRSFRRMSSVARSTVSGKTVDCVNAARWCMALSTMTELATPQYAARDCDSKNRVRSASSATNALCESSCAPAADSAEIKRSGIGWRFCDGARNATPQIATAPSSRAPAAHAPTTRPGRGTRCDESALQHQLRLRDHGAQLARFVSDLGLPHHRRAAAMKRRAFGAYRGSDRR